MYSMSGASIKVVEALVCPLGLPTLLGLLCYELLQLVLYFLAVVL